MRQRSTVSRPLVSLGGGVRLPLHVLLAGAGAGRSRPASSSIRIVSSAILSFFNYDLTNPQGHGFIGAKNFTTLAADSKLLAGAQQHAGVHLRLGRGEPGARAGDRLRHRPGLRPLQLAARRRPAAMDHPGGRRRLPVPVHLRRGLLGLANFILKKLGFIEKNLPWLMRANLAMVACVIANIWNQTPFYILMFAAGLKTIPQDVKEATLEMGASRWQEFWYVTLPSLRGIMVITSLLMVIRNFNNFPIVYTMTGGGPAYDTDDVRRLHLPACIRELPAGLRRCRRLHLVHRAHGPGGVLRQGAEQGFLGTRHGRRKEGIDRLEDHDLERHRRDDRLVHLPVLLDAQHLGEDRPRRVPDSAGVVADGADVHQLREAVRAQLDDPAVLLELAGDLARHGARHRGPRLVRGLRALEAALPVPLQHPDRHPGHADVPDGGAADPALHPVRQGRAAQHLDRAHPRVHVVRAAVRRLDDQGLHRLGCRWRSRRPR